MFLCVPTSLWQKKEKAETQITFPFEMFRREIFGIIA